MQDFDKKADSYEDDAAKPKSKLALWLENYFYHYKWHTIAALFILAVAVVCSIQLCGRESYDAYVMYAGSEQIKKTADENNTVEHQTLIKALQLAAEDYNGDGATSIALETYFWLSSAEIKELEATLDKTQEIPYSTIASNKDAIDNVILYSEYFLLLISDDLYGHYVEDGHGDRFTDLGAVAKDTSAVRYYVGEDGEDTRAVYLSSTDFYSLPGVKELPEDTVIVLRKLGAGNVKKTKEAYENAKDMVYNIINFED